MKLIMENWNRFLTEQQGTKKKIFVLVGPPSVGKSTWIEGTFEEPPYIINRDDIVEKVASDYGWTYDDMFVSPPEGTKEGDEDPKYGKAIPSPSWMTWQDFVFDKVMEANNEVQNIFMNRVSGAVPSGKNIVVDMTNMNAGARSRALKAIEGAEADYDKVAVVFEYEGVEGEIKKIAAKRAAAAKRMGKSKTIPDAAFDRMFKAYEAVSDGEGFDEIVSVDNREMLRKLASEG